MKTNPLINKVPVYLIACVLMLVGSTIVASGAAPALQGQITLRPLTPREITDYALTNAEVASGLSTVGLGVPVHIEALANNAVPSSDITNVVWTLTLRPVGSVAALAASPLGANVPTYKIADRINQAGAPVFKVAGRIMLRPDAAGLYTVTASIQTASSGSTNLTQKITAGTYMGINTCAFCHSGGVQAPDKYTGWSNTLHATFFTKAIDGLKASYYNKNCISCHTVGYDANTNAVNGGFDDVAKTLGWV